MTMFWDDQAIFALIFHPGFSTADKVTDISGRGVGMDVVRRNIEQLRGEIEIESELGHGAIFRIRLPLTLAIIDCFQVAVGNANFAIPLELVVECIDLEEDLDDYCIINLRGEPLPYITLSEIFGIPPQQTGFRCMVVVQSGRRRAGILVDRLVGELQAVIKPLGYLLQGVRGLGWRNDSGRWQGSPDSGYSCLVGSDFATGGRQGASGLNVAAKTFRFQFSSRRTT